MATYEMFWDCDHCGTTKLLGKSHRHCPGCGAAQDPTRRYYPPEDEKIAVEDHKYVGADKRCVACDAPNVADATFCVNCGAAMDVAKQVGKLEAVGEGAQAGARVPKKPAAEPEPASSGAGAAAGGIFGCGGCGALFVVAILVLLLVVCVGSLWKTPTAVTVTGHTWERSIAIEQLQTVRDTDWCDKVPSAGKEVSRTEKERSTKDVPDGQTCKTTNVDQGDGTFRKEEKCTPKTRKEPVMSPWCTYTIDRWETARTERANGTGLTPAPSWPKVSVDGCSRLGCTREGKRTEKNVVLFQEPDGTAQSCDLGQSQWAGMAVGSKWAASKSMLGALSCSGLSPAP
jgi:hypothetical protein